MDKGRNAWRTVVGIIAAVFLVSCAGPREFTGPRTIKPLLEYEAEIQRDLAQMLYPGFLQIQKEIESHFSPDSLRLKKNGMKVIIVNEIPGMVSGFYVNISAEITPQVTEDMAFLDQAHIVGGDYFHKMLMALSRDWDRIFSSSLAGTVFIFEWESGEQYRLKTVFENQNIQKYLNARMTLQELVDKSWIEGWRGEEQLGRIELNDLQSMQA